ncbi:sortase domain-bontaining protein [Streptomyces sp. NPDC008121]|uniref:class E sortase n=1 Tax=Streptomyces sp. NPDC008121 TaxID=3364809 RepID=UPI0036EB511D
MIRARALTLALLAAALAALMGCSVLGSRATAPSPAPGTTSPAPAAPSPSLPSTGTPPGAPPAAPVATAPTPDPAERTRPSRLSLPAIGIEDLRVVPYEGTTDDTPGTRIQDRGVAASPYGKGGGVGPGEVGNFLVTAHRLSAGGPLRDLPEVKKGDSVSVRAADGTVYTYEIVETRQTSFRSERSLAEQRAAVPGEPGVKPTKAMITISTCATPEDDAAGNFWRDENGNPEHRIDKIGVLTSTRPAAS